MRVLLMISLALGLGGAVAVLTSTEAAAQRYRVACVAPSNPACRTACGSNVHAVMCYANIVNGRCVRYCGRPR